MYVGAEAINTQSKYCRCSSLPNVIAVQNHAATLPAETMPWCRVHSELFTNRILAWSHHYSKYCIYARDLCWGRLRVHMQIFTCGWKAFIERKIRKLISTSHWISIDCSGRNLCSCNMHMPMQMHANEIRLEFNVCMCNPNHFGSISRRCIARVSDCVFSLQQYVMCWVKYICAEGYGI